MNRMVKVVILLVALVAVFSFSQNNNYVQTVVPSENSIVHDTGTNCMGISDKLTVSI